MHQVVNRSISRWSAICGKKSFDAAPAGFEFIQPILGSACCRERLFMALGELANSGSRTAALYLRCWVLALSQTLVPVLDHTKQEPAPGSRSPGISHGLELALRQSLKRCFALICRGATSSR